MLDKRHAVVVKALLKGMKLRIDNLYFCAFHGSYFVLALMCNLSTQHCFPLLLLVIEINEPLIFSN